MELKKTMLIVFCLAALVGWCSVSAQNAEGTGSLPVHEDSQSATKVKDSTESWNEFSKDNFTRASETFNDFVKPSATLSGSKIYPSEEASDRTKTIFRDGTDKEVDYEKRLHQSGQDAFRKASDAAKGKPIPIRQHAA